MEANFPAGGRCKGWGHGMRGVWNWEGRGEVDWLGSGLDVERKDREGRDLGFAEEARIGEICCESSECIGGAVAVFDLLREVLGHSERM